MTSRLAILAGGGDLPLRLAAAAAAQQRDVLTLPIEGAADLARYRHLDASPVNITQVARLLATLRDGRCEEIVMAGTIDRPDFSKLKPDWRGLTLLPKALAAARKGDDALLRMLIDFLEGEGFRVLGLETVAAELLAPEGVLGRRSPGEDDRADIARGSAVLDALGSLDIGQAVVVRAGRVLGIEAAEGTDALLARIADLFGAETGGVLVKLPKRDQERRIDLPTVGPQTIAGAARAGLSGIAVAAGASVIVDRAHTVEAADAAGLFLIGIGDGQG